MQKAITVNMKNLLINRPTTPYTQTVTFSKSVMIKLGELTTDPRLSPYAYARGGPSLPKTPHRYILPAEEEHRPMRITPPDTLKSFDGLVVTLAKSMD